MAVLVGPGAREQVKESPPNPTTQRRTSFILPNPITQQQQKSSPLIAYLPLLMKMIAYLISIRTNQMVTNCCGQMMRIRRLVQRKMRKIWCNRATTLCQRPYLRIHLSKTQLRKERLIQTVRISASKTSNKRCLQCHSNRRT